MLRRPWLLLALSACGRLGFDGTGGIGVDALHGTDAMMSTVDAPPVLGSVTCGTVRSGLGDTDAVELVVEGTAAPLVVWRKASGAVRMGQLDAAGQVASVTTAFASGVTRLAGAHPLPSGHALAIDMAGAEQLYFVSADLATVALRGTGEGGVGKSSVSGFGSYVFWGHVVAASPRALLFERLDDTGTPTPQSNRTTAATIRDLVVGGATASHAHLMWAEADDSCIASELFGGYPELIDVKTLVGCRSPRNASGIADSVASAYSTPAGALRFYGLSGEYEHDIELTPSGHDPSLADDGTTLWATWFDDRVGGALVIAKIELTATSATVTSRQLAGVNPVGPSGVALIGDASPPRLLVLESDALAIVTPCL